MTRSSSDMAYAEINKPRPAVAIEPMDDAPSCETVQRAPLWHFALAGAGMALALLLAKCW